MSEALPTKFASSSLWTAPLKRKQTKQQQPAYLESIKQISDLIFHFRHASHKESRLLAVSGVPRVSRTRGQSQFERPHPACSRQHRCEDWVEKKGLSKADSGPAWMVVSRLVWKFHMTVTSGPLNRGNHKLS